MIYKTFQGNELSHAIYPITKRKHLHSEMVGEGQFKHFVKKMDIIENGHSLAGIRRYIENNYHVIQQDQGKLITLQGIDFPKSMFKRVGIKAVMIQQQIGGVVFIDNILTINDVRLLYFQYGEQMQMVEPNNNVIEFENEDDNIHVVFIPQINVLLFSDGIEVDWLEVVIEYDFQIHQFQFLCNISPGQFNRTRNLSAYKWDQQTKNYVFLQDHSQYDGKKKHLIISSIGLYDENDVLMAIAKLSTPIRISQKIDTTVAISLDYVP